MRDLRQELLDAGVTAAQNWTLAVAAGVSDDGSVITGWGYPAPLTPAQPFIAEMPTSGATFTVSTSPVSSERTVTISASYACITKTASLTVKKRW